MVKIIPEKIKKKEKKKAEITTTFNIRPGGDIPTTGDTNRGEGRREEEGWGGRKTACFSSILSLGNDKRQSKVSNHHGMTTVHPNNTIIPCRRG